MLYGSMYALLALNSGRSTKLSKVVTGVDRIRKVLRRAGYRRCSGPGGGDVSNRTAKTDADGRPFIKMPWPFERPLQVPLRRDALLGRVRPRHQMGRLRPMEPRVRRGGRDRRGARHAARVVPRRGRGEC